MKVEKINQLDFDMLMKVMSSTRLTYTDKVNFVQKNRTKITQIMDIKISGADYNTLMQKRGLQKFRPLKNSFTKKGDKIKRINESVIEIFQKVKFSITNVFYMPSTSTGVEKITKLMVCVDNKNKKMAFVDYDSKKCKIVDFKDIVNYKILKDNGVDVETETYNVFDIPFTTTTTTNLCKKLQLVVVLNDENDTNIVYGFVKSGISVDSDLYKNIMNSIIEVTSYLDVIIKNTPKDEVFVYCKYCRTSCNIL